MIILDGKIVAASVKESVKAKAALLIKEHKKTPHLAAILIGTNGASETYVAKKVKTCEEIDRLESDADRVMRSAMSKLFRDEPDVREIIKLKAIYELLETITDKCEDVANQIEGIVLENS